MKIEDCILETYPTAHPDELIKSIRSRLKEKDYLVVLDEKNNFHGILTPSDILTRPSKLVIDCLTPKGIIQTDDSFSSLVCKFEKTPSEALPVFHQDKYCGILEKSEAIKRLKYRMDDFRKESMISKNVKMAFLQNLSHEVRTPLNHIIGFMSLILDLSSEEIEPNKEELYAIIRKSSEQFLSVMSDLIELSHIYSGDKIPINNDHESVKSIFTEIKANFEDRAVLFCNKLNISYHIPESSLIIYSDIKKIKLIIDRLINFSIRQIQKNDRIDFGCELFDDKQRIRFYVKKTISQIFDYPENSDPNTSKENLPPKCEFHYESEFSIELAKRMVELLGGTIDIEEPETDVKLIYFTIPYSLQKIPKPT